MAHENLVSARNKKNDEFYTRLSDIENEMKDYEDWFMGKRVYLNCDDIRSKFYVFFHDNFKRLGLSRLIATHISDNVSTVVTYDGLTETFSCLSSHGSFDDNECQDIIDECDVVISNPPFSLFISYISMLLRHDVDFIIIGNSNALFCKDVFPVIRSGRVHIDRKKPKAFDVSSDYDAKNVRILNDGSHVATFGNTCWYSTVPNRQNGYLHLTTTYEPDKYQKYDNYDAIEVSQVKMIPSEYDGIMGVPVSFIDKYNNKQFSLIWQSSGNTRKNCPPAILAELGYTPSKDDRGGAALLNGKRMYSRLFIRHIPSHKTQTAVEQITQEAYSFLMSRLEQEASMSQDGGKLRAFSGDTCEDLVRLIWHEVSKHYGFHADVIKGDNCPIIVDDKHGGIVQESVDQHCFIDDKLVLAIECKTYLDKCYMQRADSDFSLMRQNDNSFASWIVSIENSIAPTSYSFFMNRHNIDATFFLADGKRTSAHRIYEPNQRQRINIGLIRSLVNATFNIMDTRQ